MSLTSRRGRCGCATVLALLLVAVSARAGEPTDQLRAEIDRVIKVLEDPELKKANRAKERRAAIRKVANDIFDFGETARRSLARHWAQRTAAEREEFVQLLADLLERSYISKIEAYGGEKITYVGRRSTATRRPCAPSSPPKKAPTSRWTTGCSSAATSGSSTTSSSRASAWSRTTALSSTRSS